MRILIFVALFGCQGPADMTDAMPNQEICECSSEVPPHEHSQEVPEQPSSPWWTIPIPLYANDTVYSFGVQDHDIYDRRITLRLISVPADVTPGVRIRVAPVTVPVPVGGQTSTIDTNVSNDLPYTAENEAHMIQVYYNDIPAVNRGAVLSGWIQTSRGTIFLPAITGHGWARTDVPEEPWAHW